MSAEASLWRRMRDVEDWGSRPGGPAIDANGYSISVQ